MTWAARTKDTHLERFVPSAREDEKSMRIFRVMREDRDIVAIIGIALLLDVLATVVLFAK